MSSIPAQIPFAALADDDPVRPGDPFFNLRYHYGMLLGSEEFALEQKTAILSRWLHNALFHGAGTLWGLRVSVAPGDISGRLDRLEVASGLASDPLGREVHVDQGQCLEVSALHRHELWPELATLSADPDGPRRAYAVLRYQACLERPVPAIGAPCAPCGEPGENLAYSRIARGSRIDLEAKPPADPHALQREWLERVLGAPGVEPSDGRAPSFRDRLLDYALEDAERLPGIWRNSDDAPLLLAEVQLALSNDAVEIVKVDNRLRPLLPPLQLLAETVSGHRLTGPDGATRLQVAGHRATADTAVGAMRVEVDFTLSLLEPSASLGRSVELFFLDFTQGWDEQSGDAAVSAGEIRLELGNRTLSLVDTRGVWPDGTVYLLLLRGTGPTPLLDQGLKPLAGAAGEPRPDPDQGRDLSLIDTWRSP